MAVDGGQEVRGEPGRGTRDERGQMTVLIIGFAAIVLMMIVVVTDISKVFLVRRDLDATADGAVLAAANGLAAIYAQSIGGGGGTGGNGAVGGGTDPEVRFADYLANSAGISGSVQDWGNRIYAWKDNTHGDFNVIDNLAGWVNDYDANNSAAKPPQTVITSDTTRSGASSRSRGALSTAIRAARWWILAPASESSASGTPLPLARFGIAHALVLIVCVVTGAVLAEMGMPVKEVVLLLGGSISVGAGVRR